MPVRPSGAPTRAFSKSTKAKKSAPKSFKADGTPKKRWSAAERAEQGHGARRSGGQSRSSGFRTDRPSTSDRSVRSENERSFDAPEGRSYERPEAAKSYDRPKTYDRTDRPKTYDRDDRTKSYDRDDRPKSYDRADRTKSYDRDDRAKSYDRDDRPKTYDRADRSKSYDRAERPKTYDREGSKPYQRSSSTASSSYNRSTGAKSYDRPTKSFDRPERNSGWERPERSNDRPERSNDRTVSTNTSDRPERSNSYTRPERSENYDRPARSNSYDRPARGNSYGDRNGSSRGGSDRSGGGYDRKGGGYQGTKSWDRNERPTSRPRDDRSDSGSQSTSDQMSWTAREISEDSLTAVSGENGFAKLGLPKVLVSALQAEGITAPFPIQAATIPDALTGRDVLGRGQTGSGKTLGFGLPMLANLSNSSASSKAPRGIVLVPTRELAMQVADVLAPLAHTVKMTVTLIAGGMSYVPQFKAFDRGVDIVVATPGRLIDLMEQGAVDLSRIEITVLDEADHMADLGFMPAVTTILDAVPAGGQRMLFSATLDHAIDRLVRKYLTDPVTHEVDSSSASVTTMAHHVLHILPHDKNALTAEIAGRAGRTLIFVRTQRGADRVAEQLREQGVMAGALHGGLTQGARTRILAAFKDGHIPVLVATDVAARGIHVDEIGLVLQADPPVGPKD
ncbi:MAG: DEAD/DEAH box helicase, partial [Propionibacteriaceae bacterium]